MTTADYVIVGAGSAGCVLANRLTEDPSARVLLIEAGGRDRHPNIKIPAAFANQFHTGPRLGLLDRAGAGGKRPVAVHPARQVARRLGLDERDALRPRAPPRLRPLARTGRAGLGLGRRAAVLPALGGQRPRRLGVPRRRRRDADLRAALAAAARPPAARRLRRGRDPADRRLQRARAGRRVDVPGLPARRPPVERRRRVPAPGDEAPEPRGDHRARRCSASSSTAIGPSASATAARRGDDGGRRRSRGDPRGGRDRLAADPDAVGDRGRRRAAGGRGRAATRAARRRAQPPGPPVPDHALGDLGGADALRRRQAEEPARVAAAPQRAADLDRRPRSSPSSAPGRVCPRPTSSSTWGRSTSRTTARRSSTATR